MQYQNSKLKQIQGQAFDVKNDIFSQKFQKRYLYGSFETSEALLISKGIKVSWERLVGISSISKSPLSLSRLDGIGSFVNSQMETYQLMQMSWVWKA